jgi:hypothetical protein
MQQYAEYVSALVMTAHKNIIYNILNKLPSNAYPRLIGSYYICMTLE